LGIKEMQVNIDEELKEAIERAKKIFEEVLKEEVDYETFIDILLSFGVEKILLDYENYIGKKNPFAL
jgi:hypothetical protein